MVLRGILAFLVLGVAQASEADDHLDRLDELPGFNVVQVNDTAWMIIIEPTENLGVSCESAFSGNCNPIAGCSSHGICCPSSCKNCAYRDGTSLCCRIKGCADDTRIWCSSTGSCH